MKAIVFPNFQYSYNIVIWAPKYDSYGYNLYRRIGTHPYTQLNDSVLKVNFYKDTTISGDKRNSYDYKVQYLDSNGVEVVHVTETNGRIPPDRLVMGHIFPAIKIISDKSFLLGKAEYCDVLVKPSAGARCSACYNITTGDITDRWCETCQNTKYEGGYEKFEDILVRFGNRGQQLEQSEMGYELREAIQCQLQDFPIVHDKDIIVRPTGERYFVQGDVKQTQVQSLYIKQTFNVKEILVNTEYYSI